MIVDIHTHTFPDAISGKVVDQLARASRVRPFTDASRSELVASMQKAGIDWSVNLPVHTRPDQVEKINRSLAACRDEMLQQHVVTFGGMHPDYENYRAELLWLKSQGIPGIKLHPSYQGMMLDDPRMMRVIAAASQEDLIVLVHAGIDVGRYDQNYADVTMVLNVIREVQPTKLVLAHMGNWGCWDEVERELVGAPVWFDTSFSIGPVHRKLDCQEKPIRDYNLMPEQFMRLVKKHGAERVLFGTDSPWSDQREYVRMMREMPLTAEAYEMIMGGNAARLLGLR